MAHLESLRLTDFRSYDQLDLEFEPGPVALFGDNGAGKTNLLEAISLLSPGRGLRRARLTDMARQNGKDTALSWGIVTKFYMGQNESLKLSVGQVAEYPQRRQVKIAGENASYTDLANILSVMWLIPAQDALFRGASSERRKFLDRLALAHQPLHGHSVSRYEKARSERNRLLSEGMDDRVWFEAIETDMADYGAEIAMARHETICRLRDVIDQRSDSAFPKAILLLDGDMENMCEQGLSRDEIAQRAKEELAAKRHQDQRAGRSLWGVHRSDLCVSHKGKGMLAAQCSTGEQKALLLGLVLAQARALKDRSPILLLDEVAAHLDGLRREALANELLDMGLQVFLTGTDAELFSAFDSGAQRFEVANGRVMPASQ